VISETPKITPHGPPTRTAIDEFVWTQLAPRLLHPTKLAFIQLLLKSSEPLSLAELAEAVTIAKSHAAQHCRRMQAAGVLEVVTAVDRVEADGEGPFYFFPKPAEPATAASPSKLGDS
jgi:DNA-binding transcriptional ArsR family regulator